MVSADLFGIILNCTISSKLHSPKILESISRVEEVSSRWGAGIQTLQLQQRLDSHFHTDHLDFRIGGRDSLKEVEVDLERSIWWLNGLEIQSNSEC